MLFTGMLQKVFYKRAVWTLTFAILPHRCARSKKIIWLTHAYKGTATYTGPGNPVIEVQWLTKFQYIELALLGRLN